MNFTSIALFVIIKKTFWRFTANFITTNKITYLLPNGETLFKDISFSVQAYKKSALIGKNGIGKSTLLAILAGELTPYSGAILCKGSVYLMKQQEKDFHEQSIIQILGAEEKYTALKKIELGEGTQEDFEIIQNDWDIESRITQELLAFNLENIPLTRSFSSLSGGERMRLALVHAFLSDAQILLLDEPTNNLDAHTKKLFLDRFLQYKKACLIITHDRDILEKVDTIFEMNHLGMQTWGGNYTFYCKAKENEKARLNQKQVEVKKELEQAKKLEQTIQKQQAQRVAQGKKNAATRKWLKGTVDIKINSAEAHQSDIAHLLDRKMGKVQEKAKELEKITEHDTYISLPQNSSAFSPSQRIIDVENLCFSYDNGVPTLNNVNFSIQGNQRIGIEGKSGVGKSTFIKLLLGELSPLSGLVRVFVPVHVLDQNLSILDENLTLIENFMKENPSADVQQTRYALGRFRFRNESAEKKVHFLSGGERVKLALACIVGIALPSVLILDEPTNNLDIESVTIIEDVLAQFAGTLIAISHDTHFMKNLNLTQKYILSHGNLTLM